MVAHNYEKFILVFGGHKRPHLTKDNHIKNNEKRKVRLLLEEIPSFRLCFADAG